jgi:hypothetical protein
MYNMVKHCWLQLKWLKNRKRVWKDITEIVTRIENYRKEGKITDE